MPSVTGRTWIVALAAVAACDGSIGGTARDAQSVPRSDAPVSAPLRDGATSDGPAATDAGLSIDAAIVDVPPRESAVDWLDAAPEVALDAPRSDAPVADVSTGRCGDGACGRTETCTSCAADCGACPTGVLFRANMASPAMNFGFAGMTAMRDPRWDRTYLPGGGPRGQYSVRYRYYAATEASSMGNPQYYSGMYTPTHGGIPQGGSQFVRFYFKTNAVQSTACWRFRGTPGELGRALSAKSAIWGDEPLNHDRIILHWMAWTVAPAFPPPRTMGWSLCDNVSGICAAAEIPTNDVWHAVQVESRSGSTIDASDGALRIWVNNDDQARPTGRVESIVINAERAGVTPRRRWAGAAMSDFINGTMATGQTPESRLEFEFAEFEVATSFDPNWHRRM